MGNKIIIAITVSFFTLLSACDKPEGKITRQVFIPDIHSPTSVISNNGKIYLSAKESNYIFILNDSFSVIDSILVKPRSGANSYNQNGINKICISQTKIGINILAIGSGAQLQLDSAFLINPETKLVSRFSLHHFYNRFRSTGNENKVNFEGLCSYGNRFILGNRGNLAFRKNHLVVVPQLFYENQDSAIFQLSKIGFNSDSSVFMGIAGLAYAPASDRLWVLVTPEEKDNSGINTRGTGGKLWMIDNFSRMNGMSAINPVRIINLEAINNRLNYQKIESLCLLNEDKNQYKILLATGTIGGTTLYELALPKKARN